MAFEATDRDHADIERYVREIRKHPDLTAKIECFSKDEANWTRTRLLECGIPRERFFMSWLVFRPWTDD